MVAPAASHSRPEAADLLVWYDRHRRVLPRPRARGLRVPSHENPIGRGFTPDTAIHQDGRAMARPKPLSELSPGQPFADDLAPGGQDVGRGEALGREDGAEGPLDRRERDFGSDRRTTALAAEGPRVKSSLTRKPYRSGLHAGHGDPPGKAGRMVAPAASHSRPEAADLLVWYDRHRRVLPWRALPGVWGSAPGSGRNRASPQRRWSAAA
jgi:hypothetical protein